MKPKREIMTWQQVGDLIQGVELAPHAVLLKIELMNFVRNHQPEPMEDMDVGLLLLIIGESIMGHDIEASNG